MGRRLRHSSTLRGRSLTVTEDRNDRRTVCEERVRGAGGIREPVGYG
ncbi:hypothetical protein RKD19_004046 [Streptomyces canus]